MGGYEANFDPQLEDKYKCPICLTALRNPVQTRCGHRFCAACFKAVREGQWYFKCPIDNTWTNCVFEDNAAKREILSLNVKCDHMEFCEWHGELRELQQHMKTCQHGKVECPNKCKAQVIRAELEKHLLECPLRTAKCEHCQEEMLQSQLARHHLLVCPKFPIKCAVCGGIDVMRENMNGHINIINGDCPMVVVPCSFRHIGCFHQDQRIRMPKHYTEANSQHIMLLSTRLVDLEMRHRIDLEICASKFDQQVKQLLSQIEDAEKRNQQIEKEIGEDKKIQNDMRNTINEMQAMSLGQLAYYRENYGAVDASTSIQFARSSTETTTASTSQQNAAAAVASWPFLHSSTNLFEWIIELSNERKAYYSPSYELNDSPAKCKVHLWLKPEMLLDNNLFSTISLILERCDSENELPVSFECVFHFEAVQQPQLPDIPSTTSTTTRPATTTLVRSTEAFHVSGNVSKPMVLFKSKELNAFITRGTGIDSSDNAKLRMQFSIKAVKETESIPSSSSVVSS